jgi:hypothetical protein
MPRGVTPQLSEYQWRFADIAEMLDRDPELSLRGIGRSLLPHLAATAVTDCLDYLEKHYHTTLIERATKSGGTNQLTVQGRDLYESIMKSRRWSPSVVHTLSVCLSRALLTSGLLRPTIEQFVQRYLGRVNLHLDLPSAVDDELIARSLQSRALDLAILWGVEDRKREFQIAGLAWEEIGPIIDLVLVCHSQPLLDQVCRRPDKPDWRQLARRKVVVLSHQRQPARRDLPWPNTSEGGERLEVDTIDAVLACVETAVADFGLIPAIYSELDQLRAQRRLVYSPPIGKLRLALATRKSGLGHLQDEATQLVEMIKQRLEKVKRPTLSAPAAGLFGSDDNQFPSEPAFWESLAFGYYLDFDRVSAGWVKGPPQWKWEEVRLRHIKDKSDKQSAKIGSRLRFEGRILNSYGADFSVEAELFHQLFVIKATQKHGTLSSVDNFISVFDCCWREKGVLFGTWSGPDLDGMPTAFATVWSRDRLTLAELCSLARPATVRAALYSDEGEVDFDQRQPPKRTLTIED